MPHSDDHFSENHKSRQCRVWVLCRFSCVWFCASLWIVACQAPLSMGFSRQELEWVAISSSRGSSRHRDQTCISYVSCMGRQFFTTSATWEAPRQWQSSASEALLIFTSSLASPPTWSFICLSVTSALSSQLLGSTPLCLMISSTHVALNFSSSAPWVWNLKRQA